MLNMIDYLKWRGDVRMTCSPFNDADNLIQEAKRKARGYHTFEGYCTAIFLAVDPATS